MVQQGERTRVPVAYLGGIGRSGSTVLGRILGSFDGVLSLGEVVHLWDRGLRQNQLCGCGHPFSACEFWQTVGERAYGSWSRVSADDMVSLQREVDRNRFLPWLMTGRGPAGYQSSLAEYRNVMQDLYSAAAEVSGSAVLVDTSKNVPFAWLLSGVETIDLRVVHLVRDSRGVAYSWAKTVRRPEVTDQLTFMPKIPATKIATRWMFDNTVLEVLARFAPVLRVRYEDLLADPTTQLSQILSFASISPDPELIAAVAAGEFEPGQQHEVSGNPLRFSEGPIALRPDLAWREDMPLRDRRIVTAVSAPLMLRYDYPFRSPPT